MRAPLLAFAVWAGLVATAAAVTSYNTQKFETPMTRASTSVSVGGLLVPLTDAPFQRLVDAHSSVAFDFTGAGDRRAQGWLTRNAAWLVWDPHWGGAVNSGVDLIGQHTWSSDWNDGFEALAALDVNNDGELTGAELGGLSLWHDENGDGVSEPGEVVPVNVHGIVAISVRGGQVRNGVGVARAGVRFDDGSTRPLYEWMPRQGGQHAS
ncbi:MAG: hypothetical protein QM759_09635 [Terricaulis sp.]